MTNPIDVHVGKRVTYLRLLHGYSQKELGNALGISFQQIQKYEAGRNRISAGKLYEMSKFFKVPVMDFFHHIEHPDAKDEYHVLIHNTIHYKELLTFINCISNIDPDIRHHLLDLLKAIKESSEKK